MADLPPFADCDDLAQTLGVEVPGDALTLGKWISALDDASGYIRWVVQQPITAGTVTLDLVTDDGGIARPGLVPVTAVTEVLDYRDNTVTWWELRDGMLFLPRACARYRATLDYGWDPIPQEIIRWTKNLAAAQVANTARGALGSSAGTATSVAVDDAKVTYGSGTVEVAIPDSVAQSLRATYGAQ